MIFFYIKETGEIVGTVEGRVHPEQVLSDNFWMIPTGYSKEQVGKYVVPFKEKKEMVDQPVFKNIVNLKTKEVQTVQVGTRKIEQVTELEPDVPFSDLVYDFEKRRKIATGYKLLMNKKGEITGLEKKAP